jgi:hypothetical protein
VLGTAPGVQAANAPAQPAIQQPTLMSPPPPAPAEPTDDTK